MVLVILESGLMTRLVTLFSSLGLCKCPLYVIWAEKAVVMNGFQDDENRLWQFWERKKTRRDLGWHVPVSDERYVAAPVFY
jgi:hypothetical protein